MYNTALKRHTLSTQVILDLFDHGEFELLDFEGVTPSDIGRLLGKDAEVIYLDWIYSNLK